MNRNGFKILTYLSACIVLLTSIIQYHHHHDECGGCIGGIEQICVYHVFESFDNGKCKNTDEEHTSSEQKDCSLHIAKAYIEKGVVFQALSYAVIPDGIYVDRLRSNVIQTIDTTFASGIVREHYSFSRFLRPPPSRF